MKSRAFTLIEFLVVLAVLAVIAAILFPIFARSREPGGHSSCQSNLKQIGLGFAQYIQDFNDIYPPAHSRAQNLGTHLGGYAGSLQSYLKSDQIYQCPSERTNATEFLIDYGYSSSLAGVRQKQLSHAANTILNYELSEPALGADAVGELTSPDAPGRSRHLDGSNYSFADGHVKWIGKNKIVGSRNVRPNGSNFTFGIR